MTMPERPSTLTYKDAGVDIDAAEALVETIKPLAASTRRRGVVSGLGGFAALFDLKEAGFRDPILVTATDGVGTKLRVALETDRHDTVGIDLVAMCVNDLVTSGAEPLLFLDYYATGRLDPAVGRSVLAGIAEGCRRAGCALVGGETAEMPGMYMAGDYDLAGFAVGAAERERLLADRPAAEGDVILGLASSGLHANGFSLARRVVERAGLDYRQPAPFRPDRSLADAFLEPTRIYVAACLAAIEAGGVKGLAHITGGGLLGYLRRILPNGLVAEINTSSWPIPEVFTWLAESGGIGPVDMARTFNCGIGMALVVEPDRAPALAAQLAQSGEAVFEIGRIVGRVADGPPVYLDGV